jgi:fructose transport system ATP-binding protein
MRWTFEVADRIHIQRLGRCAGVISPQSHTMARDGGDRTESTGTGSS